jgi:hypothetical protein
MTNMHDNIDGDPLTERDLQHIGALLRGSMPSAVFTDGFTDRTMARLAASRIETSPTELRFAAMQRSFRVLAAAAAVMIAALGVNNILLIRSTDTSIVEAAIGLQPVNVESLLSSNSQALQ